MVCAGKLRIPCEDSAAGSRGGAVGTRRSRLALAVALTLLALGVGPRPASPQAPQEVKVMIERDRFVPAEIRVVAGRSSSS